MCFPNIFANSCFGTFVLDFGKGLMCKRMFNTFLFENNKKYNLKTIRIILYCMINDNIFYGILFMATIDFFSH